MAKKRKERIDLSGDADAPLGDSPFAGLGGLREALPTDEAAPKAPASAPSKRPYTIGKTRKGGFALSIEKRGGGKCVTLLGNVEGDAKALLKALKGHCGAGGAVREDSVEIQGDHREKIRGLLDSGRL